MAPRGPNRATGTLTLALSPVSGLRCCLTTSKAPDPRPDNCCLGRRRLNDLKSRTTFWALNFATNLRRARLELVVGNRPAIVVNGCTAEDGYGTTALIASYIRIHGEKPPMVSAGELLAPNTEQSIAARAEINW
jgi:hypothetical protein